MRRRQEGAFGLSKSESPGWVTNYAEQLGFLHKMELCFRSNSLPLINYFLLYYPINRHPDRLECWICQLFSKAGSMQIMCHPQWPGKRCFVFGGKKRGLGTCLW